MRPSPRHTPTAPRRLARRGFVFLLVLMIISAGVIVISSGINRAVVKGAIIQRQLDGYQQHHELLGIRDLVKFWLVREQADSKLAEYASVDEPATRILLPDNLALVIRIRDGQGTLRARLQPGDAPEVEEMLLDVLSWVPMDRRDLLRRTGPLAVSLRAAPNEVVAALARGNPDVEAVLRKLRDQESVHRGIFVEELQRAGVTAEEIKLLSELVAFEQTRLWRIEVDAVDVRGTRTYAGLVQMDRTTSTWFDWKAETTRQPDRRTSDDPFAPPTPRR